MYMVKGFTFGIAPPTGGYESTPNTKVKALQCIGEPFSCSGRGTISNQILQE
jgi:hypothetical protein